MEAPGECPVCRRIDAVQRVTAIYNESFSTMTRLQSQMTYGANGRLTTTMRPVTTTQQTILGKLLAPPKPRTISLPPGEQMILVFAISFSMLLFLYGQDSLLTPISEMLGENMSWVLPCLLIALLIFIWLLTHFVIFREANQERWQQLLQEQECCQRRR